jgi:hypothetical protein
MALINPSNLYSGGQGILRDDFVNFVANQQAKRKAIDEASNQYFEKALREVNPAGVRTNDQPYINQRISELQTYWLQNKDAIKKGGLPQQEFLRMVNERKFDIDTSKYRSGVLDTLGKAKFAGTYNPREDDLKIIDVFNLPINDPRSKKQDGTEYSLADFSASAKPLTTKDIVDFKKAAIGSFKPTYDKDTAQVRYGDSGKILVTKKFTPDAVKAIGEEAAALVTGNKRLKWHYEDLMNNSPTEVEKATKALQRVYGDKFPDGSNVLADTPFKMAQGLMINDALNTAVEEEEIDKEAANAFKKKLQDERIAATLKNLRIREAGRASRLKTIMDGVEMDDVIANAKEMGTEYPWEGKGNVTLVPVEQLDPVELEDILGKKDKYGQYPIKPYTTSGRDYIVINQEGQVETPDGVILPERVKNNTFNRTKGFLKAKYKKEVKVPTGGSEEKPGVPSLNATKRRKG